MEVSARLRLLECSRETYEVWLLSSLRALVQKEWVKPKGLWAAPP